MLTKKITVLVTGATGLVGGYLSKQLELEENIGVRIAVRASNKTVFNNNEAVFYIEDISGTTDWGDAVKQCDVVIHAAAHVHVMKEKAKDPLKIFRRVNVDGTLALARQAASCGVKRFIFISSMKVFGENPTIGCVYKADDEPNPIDAYGISKYEAEQKLVAFAVKTGMEVVIIRPPMVYGPGAKGNFNLILEFLRKGYPLPLKSIENKRSFVSIYNLTDLIVRCISHPRAANQILMVSDGEDLSTVELFEKTARAMNKPARLFPLPTWILKNILRVLGKEQIIQRLFGSLQIDINKTSELLDWKPKLSVDECLRRAVHEI